MKAWRDQAEAVLCHLHSLSEPRRGASAVACTRLPASLLFRLTWGSPKDCKAFAWVLAQATGVRQAVGTVTSPGESGVQPGSGAAFLWVLFPTAVEICWLQTGLLFFFAAVQ